MDKLPKRKNPRLREYDYSSPGSYFITVCVRDRKPLLSFVGRGLAPTVECETQSEVGRGLAPADIELTSIGQAAEQQLLALQTRYPHISVDSYVIMPNHIHIMLTVAENAAGASPRPTVYDAICAFKSLTARECGKKGIFQTSFYDHIIRDERDYITHLGYINDNPAKWKQDEYYV